MMRLLHRVHRATWLGSAHRTRAGMPPAPEEPVEVTGAFYVPSPSCQIPTLAFLYELFFGRRNDGRFVEVGAYDGYSFSNTSCLAAVGWSGLYVEAVPRFAEECRTRYAGNDRIAVVNAAVGDRPGALDVVVGGPYSTSN